MKVSCISFTERGARQALLIRDSLCTDLSMKVDVWKKCEGQGELGSGQIPAGTKRMSTEEGQAPKAEQTLKADLAWTGDRPGMPGTLALAGSLQDWVKDHFESDDGIVFVSAVGIAVRLIAPLIRSKDRDPAVVVVDEAGKWAISLLSGHLGGANELTAKVAEGIGAEAIITTATDLRDKFAVDLFAKSNRMVIGDLKLAKEVSAAVLSGKPVGFFADPLFSIEGKAPQELTLYGPETEPYSEETGGEALGEAGSEDTSGDSSGWSAEGRNEDGRADKREGSTENTREDMGADGEGGRFTDRPYLGISVSLNDQRRYFPRNLNLTPRAVVLGVGSRKGVDVLEMERFLISFLDVSGVSLSAVTKICSIEQKGQEEAILSFSRKYGLPYQTFTAQQLIRVPGRFSASSFVEKTIGVGNVCERSAVLGAMNRDLPGKLIVEKKAYNGMTAALALVQRRYRWEDWTRNV